jgi:hypothetical protein
MLNGAPAGITSCAGLSTTGLPEEVFGMLTISVLSCGFVGRSM